MSLLLATALQILAWEGRATVNDGKREISIAVRTRMEADRIVSESWPVAEGEARGLRRLIITTAGTASLERGGKVTALPADFAKEELAQFAFYRQLQDAAHLCAAGSRSGVPTAPFVVEGRTSFRCKGQQVRTAANWVERAGEPILQEFKIDGLWRSGGAVFPRRLEIRRGGAPFFTLEVTRFRSDK